MICAILKGLGGRYTTAHGVRLALTRPPRPVTVGPPASVPVPQPTTLGRLGEVP
jgi:hypothetical protein